MNHDPAGKLRVEGVRLCFGGLVALDDVSLAVREREILAIIGPNGSGKTSILNCVNGFYRPQRGEIYFEGRPIIKVPSHKRAKLGIARVFQNVELYTGLTTLDNLMAARYLFMRHSILEGALYYGRAHSEEIAHRRVVEEIIDFLEIQHIRRQVVGVLPYGLRKRVELGRALALEPRILLLDEPMAGMNLEEKEDMARFILDIYETRQIPIVLIEHDIGMVMDIADRIIVLDAGRVIAEGPPQKIASDPLVIAAYLGEDNVAVDAAARRLDGQAGQR